MVYIYVLKLKYNKYYVGKTTNPNFRLNDHFDSEGSVWTKKYKPINVHELRPDCSAKDETIITQEYMKKYGIDNVRGGPWCSLDISEHKNTIEHMIHSESDNCYKCGKSGHFANLLQGIYGAVPKLIKQIHFDPEHPENQNIKFTNKKYPYLKIMKDNKWQLVNKKPELLDLIDSKCFMLKEKYYKILEKKQYKLSDIQKNKIDTFIDKYQEEDTELILDLINRTELVLLNNS